MYRIWQKITMFTKLEYLMAWPFMPEEFDNGTAAMALRTDCVIHNVQCLVQWAWTSNVPFAIYHFKITFHKSNCHNLELLPMSNRLFCIIIFSINPSKQIKLISYCLWLNLALSLSLGLRVQSSFFFAEMLDAFKLKSKIWTEAK